MEADWDLHAVVRGCAAVNTTQIPTVAATDNEFSISPSLPFHYNENSFDDFSGLFDDDETDPFLGLHEIYQVFCVDPPPETNVSAAATPVAQVFQPHDQTAQIQPLPLMNMPRQESMQLRNASFPSPLSFPATNSQPVRQRRRKNQQTRMIREMTQEQLAADSWAWRKYGQKPIKGSPYPRNYYRCNTSKGCAARNQVERNLNDPEIFVVSYTSEHTHPRPIYRGSLAGMTHNKFGPTIGQNKINTNNNDNYNHTFSLPMGSHSSPGSGSGSGSGSSFSPGTPTTEGEATKQNNDVEMAENVGNDDDDENIMMVNDLMMNDDDDIFKGFKDSDESSGGDPFLGGALMSPAWTPTDYIAAATMYDGEGGD